jgi:pilus assembly protein CpaE
MPAAPTAGTAPSAATEALPPTAGHVVSVFSAKGGVGCSTIAVNLAIALQQNSASKVAVVDTSLQFGDVGVLLNLYASRTIADLASLADELDDELLNDIFIAHSSGVKALLAPARPEVADTVTPALVTDVLDRLRKLFDVIIIDTGSVLDDVVLNVLDLSDKIIVVTTPEIPSIKNAKLFFEVTEALEYERERIMFVLNKTDKRINIRAEDIEGNIKYRIEGQLPLDERTVTTSVNQGIPYVLGNKNSLLSQATIELSKRLLKSLEEDDEIA